MRSLTIAAALLVSSTSVLAQTAQPMSPTPADTATPQASSTDPTGMMGSDTAATPPTNSPTAVGTPAPDMVGNATPRSTSAQAGVETGADTPTMNEEENAAAAVSIGSGAMSADASTTAAWSASDSDSDGALSPLEFAMYVHARDSVATDEAKRQRYARASGNGAIKLLNDSAGDFSKADKNMDRRIDAAELAAWNGSASAGVAAPAASGAGVMKSPTVDMTTAPQADASVAPADASDAPDGKMADDTMATDTPPKN